MGGQDFSSIIHDAADKALKDKHPQPEHPSAAHLEAMQTMQATSREQQELASTFQAALKEGKISGVLQDKIRQRVIAALPRDEQETYQQETRQFGAAAVQKGAAHLLVEHNVGQAEHMLLGQAIRQAGLGRIQNIDGAIRVFQNPQGATKEDWIKLGLTVGTHGMIPPEISGKLSHSLALESGRFFSGTGTGSFADMSQRIQTNMKPLTEKVGTAAGDALETGKHAATGFGKWFKGKVVDPAKERLHKDDQ